MQAAVEAARGTPTPAAPGTQEAPDDASTAKAAADTARTEETSAEHASAGKAGTSRSRDDPEAAYGTDDSPEPITEPLPRLQAALTTHAQTAARGDSRSPQAASDATVTPAQDRPAGDRPGTQDRPAGDRPETQDRPAGDRPGTQDRPGALDRAVVPRLLGRPDRRALPRRDPSPGRLDPPSRSVPRRPAEPDQPASSPPSRPRAALPAATGPAPTAPAGQPGRDKQPDRKKQPAQRKRSAQKRQSAQDTDQVQPGWPAEGGWPAVTGLRSAETPDRRAGGKARASRPRVVGVAAVAVVLVAAATVAAVLTSQARPPKPAANRTAGPPATTASRAADWVASQVSHDAVVACDHLMCSALAAAGFPGRHLQRITSASPYPVHSDVVVVTPAVQHQFGSSLATGWAPDVLAKFGSGSATVTIRVVSAQGAAAYQSALNADLKLRRAGGAGLLASHQITASPQARRDLISGQVDARLIIVLTALASVHPVDIVAFGTVFNGTSVGLPLRMADIAEDDAAARLSPSAYLRFLNTVVHEQPTQYALQMAGPVPSKGQPVFQIQFSAPSPLGLLGPQGP